MNKALLTLLLAVCVLGMALILLNERLSGDTPPIQTQEDGQFPPLGTMPSAPQRTLPLNMPKGEPAKNEHSQPAVSSESPLPQVRDTDSAKNKPTPPPTVPEKVQDKKADNAVGGIRPIAKTEQDIRASEKEREVARRESAKEKVQAEKEPQPQKKEEKENPAKAENQKQKITKFVVFSREKGATVRLVGNADLKYKTSQMHSPERVLIELDGNWEVSVPQIPQNPLVNAIRIGRQNNKTRIVLDLKAAPKTCRTVNSKEKQVDVRVDL